jgi:colanic acid biosynthesis glycosyl transferase WcaI
MKILLITDSYPPEVRSASRLMKEFAQGMCMKGHSVTVLTTLPEYNLATGARKELDEVEMEQGVHVVRIGTMKVHLVGMIRRGIGVLILPWSFIRAGRKHVSENDVVLVYSPPLTLSVAGIRLARFYKSKCVVNIQDLFPQNAIDLGILKNRLLIALFEAIERYAYKKTDFITVHSRSNRDTLVEQKKVDRNKVEVFHNWIDVGEQSKDEGRSIDFRKDYGLGSSFVILFGGVVGPAQGLDVIVPAAERLRDVDVRFLVVGDGTEKRMLQERAEAKGLHNIVFKPFIDPADFDLLLESVDAGLVTLSKEMKTPVVPGKIGSYMAKKLPVIASLNKESDGIEMIREAGCGFAGTAGDGEELAKNILNLLESPGLKKTMGEAGWRYAQRAMSKEVVLDQYADLFQKLVSSQPAYGDTGC